MFGKKKRAEAKKEAAEKVEAEAAIAEKEAQLAEARGGQAKLQRWLQLGEGSIVEVEGMRCQLTYINTGKRRLTLVPVDPIPMPRGSPSSNPQVLVTKGRMGKEKRVRVA